MQARLFHLHALSALHCGTGQSAGVVDLPIARARATQLPLVPGSSLRGVLRDWIGSKEPEVAKTLFGPETIRAGEDSFAGALAVGDAHLLLLPVRSLAGIVCYATCPFILRRYAQDLGRADLPTPQLPPNPAADGALIPAGSVNTLQPGNKLILEDIDLIAAQHDAADAWAQTIAKAVHPADPEAQGDLKTRFAILPDDALGFLAETATEIRARIAIDKDKGTVKRGALWYEENLPAETVLWGLYALSEARNGRQADLDQRARELLSGETLLQLGGKAGVGRGLVRLLTTEA